MASKMGPEHWGPGPRQTGPGWNGEPLAGTRAGRRYSRCIAENGSALQCISMGRQRSGSSAAAAAVSPLKLNFRT